MKTNATMEGRDGRNLRHPSAVGLLLLTLLAANPLQGFSQQQGVINTGSTTGVVLTNLFGPTTNFVTVTNGVTIDNSISGSNAVFGNTYFWNLTNAATLNGNTNGVYMDAGGSVNNLTNGTITGGQYGVYITGGTNSVVSVVNAGSIRGTNNDGVYMGTNGSVNNLTNGIITGGANGVYIAKTGSVVNAGSIIGTNGDGVVMNAGGSVNNLTNRIITGQYGVYITQGAGTVINTGSITGTNYTGVFMNAGGSVNNLTTNGIITGGQYGVYFGGSTAGFVTNAGSITGKTNDGVYLGNGGSVSNLSGGIITGGYDGVHIINSTGSVVNAGSIISQDDSAVYMGAGGSVNNLSGGSILGGTDGDCVFIIGGAGTVINAGSITGSSFDGVYMGGGGSVDNQSSGSISGGSGVEIFGGTGSVVNASSIIGSDHGVHLGQGGSVDNLTGGHITGGQYGVEISGGAGYVTNAGLISGGIHDGVYMGTNGSVNNLTTNGIIYGGQYGVEIYGSTGSVVNAGSIIGTTNHGVFMDAGGSVNNQLTGIIHGGGSGVAIVGGTGLITNAGSIIGQTVEGVYLGGGGSVNNQTTNGIIMGGIDGVGIFGDTGSVINAGSIIGQTGDGVYMGNGGSVNNQAGGTIYGHVSGVYITGDVASVTNAGTIVGSNGIAISLGNYSNTVVLQTGSLVQGNIVGGTSTDAAFLQGHGSYSNNFLHFETLTVQGDSPTNGWNLTGNNIFSTNTTVESGLLQINGSLTSPLVTVSNGASLGGTGTVFSIVNSHGVIAPGNSIGTLYFVGGLNMTNSIYNEQVDAAGHSDLINVSGSPGTAIISNASVVVLPAREIYGVRTVYTNLTATGGVLGTNAGVSITPTWGTFPSWLGFAASLDYSNADMVMTILNRNAFVTVANTYNQHSVAGALDGIVGSPGAMSNLVGNFSYLSTAAEARAALDSMSGEIHGSLGMLDVQQQDAFNNSVALRTGRMSAGGESGGYGSAKPVQLASAGSTLPPMQQQSGADQLLDNAWLQGFGTFGHLDGDGNASGGNFTISGLSGGLDYRLCPEMLVGLAVGYSHDDASVGGPGASGSVDAIQFAGYGGYVNGPWHLDGIFSYGYLQTDTKRFINVGSIHQEADGSYNGNVFSLSTEGGYAFEAGPVTIEPTVGLNYTHLSQDSFQETGAGPNGLNVHSVEMDSVRTALGVRLAAQFGEKDGVQFIPALRASWEHEFMDKTADVNASFIGGSGDFVVRGVELGADSGVLGVGLTVAFNKAIQGFVNYDAHLNTRMSSHAISGGLSYLF